MADVRSLLRNERNARRISHPHATYSTTGTLVCLVCHIQLKSESLWNGHLRSAQHAMRLQRIRDGTLGRPPGAPPPESEEHLNGEEDSTDTFEPTGTLEEQTNGVSAVKSNKRKAAEDEQPLRKRSRADALPEGFYDEGPPDDAETAVPQTSGTPPIPGQDMQLPSRPATPLKALEAPEAPIAAPKPATVDEDEWAAFEADIAAAEAPSTVVEQDAVISAPAMSAAELASKSKEEEIARRKERQEAEMEGDKEDAARKLEDEFEEMAALEERIRKLKEKREALRLKDTDGKAAVSSVPSDIPDQKINASDMNGGTGADEEDEEEEEDDDDDDWDGFRLKV